ncbi:prepilin-type N-terminal cleavage/methylation domain-containing protein [Microbacterium lacticum]|uniref:Prepilin-type N-terminal cleavage/methylation domain-containing protein n=3 Tax=Microbacterium lacticum TaxID=33885 RepID=A0A543KYC1_9MICO|nr:prepilin-type N-terminal cleavage/methylation domain-containing protein [Microbacterium lacticum]
MRPRSSRSDAGLTLLELLVAMGVSSILIALVATVFVTTSRVFTDEEGATDSARMASTAMNEVTRVVRAGTELPESGKTANTPVFAYAGAGKIEMAAFIDAESSKDPAPVKVSFGRNSANELVETRWAADRYLKIYWKFRDSPASARTIARSLLAPDKTRPLFRYFDKDGAALTPAAGASLSEDQRRNIASVQITMQVQANGSGRTAPVAIQNMVGLPNLGVARVEVK